jgi:orotate phosphoribosyltransferase-like protein
MYNSFQYNQAMYNQLGAIEKALDDTISSTDTIEKFSIAQALADALNVSEETAKYFIREAFIEAVGLDAEPGFIKGKTFNTTIHLVDKITGKRFLILEDAITISDSISFAINKAIADSLSATETKSIVFLTSLSDEILSSLTLIAPNKLNFGDALPILEEIENNTGKSVKDTIILIDEMWNTLPAKSFADILRLADWINVRFLSEQEWLESSLTSDNQWQASNLTADNNWLDVVLDLSDTWSEVNLNLANGWSLIESLAKTWTVVTLNESNDWIETPLHEIDGWEEASANLDSTWAAILDTDEKFILIVPNSNKTFGGI